MLNDLISLKKYMMAKQSQSYFLDSLVPESKKNTLNGVWDRRESRHFCVVAKGDGRKEGVDLGFGLVVTEGTVNYTPLQWEAGEKSTCLDVP